MSIGQAIERSQDVVNAGDGERQEWKKVLEQSGVKVDVYGHSKGIPLEWAMRSAIIFCYQTVKAIPLKGTRHQEQPIQQTLGRIVLGGIEAKKAQRRVGGVQGACVLLPLDPFLEKYGGVDGRQRELLEKGGF